jgi:membrane-bound lytic murein transglycosylase A
VLRFRPSPPLVPAAPPPLSDDRDLDSLRIAIERTRAVWGRSRDAAREAAADRLLAILDTVPDPAARADAVARDFRVLRVRRPVLLTAYYEPELAARLVPDATFRHPLYARPRDGCSRLPTRAEIDAGALAGRGLEIAWVADPVEAFVLQVQGSGRLRLEDGRRVGARYAGSNGLPYRSIVPALAQRGLVSRCGTTLSDIRRALGSLDPNERAAVLATNERYVFFQLADGGPVGSVGVPLTAGRSIATDPRLVPSGALAYVATPSVQRFVVSQDVGAAITGPHVDLFVGAGPEAEVAAGAMRERGALYVLVPR